MVYILYNRGAGGHLTDTAIKTKMQEFLPGEEFVLTDVTSVDEKQEYVDKLSNGDKLVIVGGDGTLNRFVNAIEDKDYPFEIYCYAGGTGNDFINDVIGVNKDEIVLINEYIRNLPVIEVNGKSYKFLNGIGYGIDGYACEEGEKYRAKKGKAPNYTTIALKGFIYDFKTANAKVTIDGVTREYKNVWLAPTMNGKYFGGGMKITPPQDRLNPERKVTAAVLACKSRLRLLTIFPKVFKGNHVKYTKYFNMFQGYDVRIEFDRAMALQIDGEVIPSVKEYTVKSAVKVKEPATV